MEHLREACNTAMEKAIFEFMFSTGCRIGEVVSLDKIKVGQKQNKKQIV